MKHLALYRKYRPSKFDDVFGQKYIVDIVKKSIINNKISHAYLFSGPRGTGKTSMAKLIAKTINCSDLKGIDACEKCNSCTLTNSKANPDIIEIDAASNNGVDEIRNIRDNVALMPSVSEYKVYIIDEVHMLTTGAFNALLKTLEEPPAHVIFILATTELYKVPETIVSRCQCFEFERISASEIEKCLLNIANNEKINVDQKVLTLIANYSKGGLRDSIGILDKLSSCSDHVTEDLFYDVVGVVNDELIKEVVNLIKSKKQAEILKLIDEMSKNGKNLSYLVEQIITKLKNDIINNSADNYDYVILQGLNDIFNNIKYSYNYLLSLEIGILKIINSLKKQTQIISREIISSNDEIQKIDVTTTENDDKIEIKLEDNTKLLDKVQKNNEVLNEQKDNNANNTISENEQKFIDEVGINNAFALANKKLKIEMQRKWRDFNDYVHNKEFSAVTSYFLDSKLEVAGEKDVIISVENEAIISNANYNKTKIELLFNLVMGGFYNIIFVTAGYFENLKNRYIEDIKSGKKYEYIDNIAKNDDIIIEEQKTTGDNSAFESAKDIFGSDIVEMK